MKKNNFCRKIVLIILLFPVVVFAQETEPYNLKIKLNSKFVNSRIYYQDKVADWRDEIKNWEIEFISKEDINSFFKAGQKTSLNESKEFVKCLPRKEFADILLSGGNTIALSRSVEINLEEFPFSEIEAEIPNKNDQRIYANLGIDYMGDNDVDGYVRIDTFSQYYILDKIKKELLSVNEVSKGFILRKIFFIHSFNKNMSEIDNEIYIFRLKNLKFYNEKSIQFLKRQKIDPELMIQSDNMGYTLLKQNEKFKILCYHDTESKHDLESRTAPKDENNQLSVYIQFSEEQLRKIDSLSFDCEAAGQEAYDVRVYAIFHKSEDISDKVEMFSLSPEQYKKNDDNIVIDINNIFQDDKSKYMTLVLEVKLKKLLLEKEYFELKLGNFQLNRSSEGLPYPLKALKTKEKFTSLLSEFNPVFLKIDEEEVSLNSFKNWEKHIDDQEIILQKIIDLRKGKHHYEKVKNSIIEIEWVILEPVVTPNLQFITQEPEIIFKKINPVKYLVNIKGANYPFWLVFSESFHEQWKLYESQVSIHKPEEFNEIVADYPHLHVKESRGEYKFSFEDVKLLFKKPLKLPHYFANGYANCWRVEPSKLGLNENFTIIIYFWPQLLYYLGLIIFFVAVIACLFYLKYLDIKKKGAIDAKN
ncbi:MAG: hypothetical protein ABIG64_05735 [Candidatus Omnitrophota bacterium]